MAYLLILPLSLYTALAAVAFHRRPRGVSALALTLYAGSAALATALFLILGTTSDRALAEAAAALLPFASIWAYAALLPLTLVGLYFESWLHIHYRRLIGLSVAVLVPASILLLWMRVALDDPLVYPLGDAGWMPWLNGVMARYWIVSALVFVLSQSVFVVTIAVALRRDRVSLWRGALPLTLVMMVSVLLPVLAPLAGAEWMITVAALGYVPPVLLFTVLLVRSSREITLDALIRTTLRTYSDGMLLINQDYRVMWRNLQIARWLSAQVPPGRGVTSPHIFELLRGTALLPVVRDMLTSGQSTSECEVVLDGEEYILQISAQALNVRNVPGAQLLIFRDVTASRVRRNLDERRQELLALSAISADISSSLDREQVITRALQQVLTVTRGDTAAVYLVDEDDPLMLRLAGRLVVSPSARPAQPVESVTGSTKGHVLQTRKSEVIHDTRENAQFGPRFEAVGLRAGITVPLTARDEVIGVLQIGMKTPHMFDGIEVALLESVGQQLAVAIDNARLHQQERQQRRIAEVLREVANLFASRTLDDALQTMLVRLGELLDFDRATVLLRAEPGKLRIGAATGLSDPESPDALAAVRVEIERYPYLAHMFSERSGQVVPDVAADSLWEPGEHDSGSWLGVPLVTRDQVLGCINLSHARPGHFTAADQQIASTFADQAVIAVENARLFETEQHGRVQAERLQQASYTLVTSPDLSTALSATLDQLATIITFDRAHVGLIDYEARTWTFHAAYPATLAPVPVNQPLGLANYPLVQRIMADKRPLLVPDTRQETTWRTGSFNNREIRCWAGIPLIVRGEVVGLLSMDGFKPGSFSDEEIQVAQAVANQIAAVLENFRLLEEASNQNRALSTLNTILAASNEALTHENLLAVSLERVLDTLGLSGGAIHRYDAAEKTLRLRAVSGLPDVVVEGLQRVPLNGDLASLTLAPITGMDGTVYEFFSAPMVSHGVENGLLSICRCSGEAISADLQTLLVNIGQQLGVVIDNAVLFEDAARRVTLSTNLGRLSLAISAQLDRSAVLDLICEQSTIIFDVQGAYIWLLEDKKLVGVASQGFGADRFAGHTIDLGDPALLPVRVISEWQARYVNHVAGTGALPEDFLEMTHAQAVLAVPMLKAEVPTGVLLLVNTQTPDAFADWMIEQIGLLGVQAALAIQTATLFDEVRRRLDQLRLVNEVGRYATAILSPPTLVEGVARKLFDILGYDVIGLLQVEEGQLNVNSIFVRDRPSPVEGAAGRYLAPDSASAQAVLRSEPILQNLTCESIMAVPDKPDGVECCILAVPLIIADEVIGVLVVERANHDSIGQGDLDVLEPLAAQLAISVSNALLYEKVRKQAVELEARVAQRTEEIRQQQERTEAILRSVADAVIVFDLVGQVVMTNPVARTLFDQHDLDMDLGGHVDALVARSLEADARDSTEIIELDDIVLQAKAARVVEGDAVLGSVVVLRDISRLQELDRMKDLFVSNVSHELRTPLANLKLYLSLLQQGRPERRDSYLEVMGREVDRLARLISDLLHISRLQSEQRAERPRVRNPVHLDHLIDVVIQDNTAWAENERKELLHERLVPSLPVIYGDSDQLVRAMTNLVSNAISYTLEGGRIVVRSGVEPGEHSKPEWVIIEISDTGIGIPENELGTVFERFYRGTNVSPTIPGTGLGLAIIKDIVELHDGSIDVTSEQGKGSTFRLKFPVADSES